MIRRLAYFLGPVFHMQKIQNGEVEMRLSRRLYLSLPLWGSTPSCLEVQASLWCLGEIQMRNFRNCDWQCLTQSQHTELVPFYSSR